MPGASWAFVDDLKFVLPANERDWTLGQVAERVVQDWSHAHMLPLSIEKSIILHCNVHNACHVYMFEGQSMRTTDVFKDLNVLRSSHHHYNEHVASLSASCRRFAGMIRRVFCSRDANLLRKDCVTYVKPKVMYASQA